VEIARSRGLHPSTVSRFLKRAREEGIVRIDITRPRHPDDANAQALAERYGLRRAIVVPAAGEEILSRVAASAARYVSGLLVNGMRFSISWGSTLHAVVRAMRPSTVSGLEMGQLMGGVGYASPGIQGHELLGQLAGLFPHTRVHYLDAPAIVDSALVRGALLRERSIRSALDFAANSELALVGIGTVDGDSPLVRYGHLRPSDRERIVSEGAVGNICARLFTLQGSPVDDELDQRTIAVEWDQIAKIPTVVAVACGGDKRDAIKGALLTGCVNALITDSTTASLILSGKPDAVEGTDGRGPG
jgi:deoxyribonucleoside regulator